jgi:diketogulonate reductase-like aldo/keto reductase
MKLPLIGQGAGHKGENLESFETDFSNLVNSVQIGIENGMNFVDTAEIYADGRSEIVVGSAVSRIRSEVLIASKFSTNHHKRYEVIKALDQSLTRMNTEYVDLYQIHWPNNSVPLEETLGAMWELKSKGKITEVGLCNVNRTQLIDAISIAKKQSEKIYSVQIKFNLNDRFAYNQIADICKLEDIKIIAYSPVRNVLPLKNDQKSLINEIAVAIGATPIQVALNWVISHVGVSAIPESSKPKHLIELARSREFTLSELQVDALDASFKSKAQDLAVRQIHSRNLLRRNTAKELAKNQIQKFSNDFCPSIMELSEEISSGNFLQPIIVKLQSDSMNNFEIIEGELRYWAFVVCNGADSLIPAVVIE